MGGLELDGNNSLSSDGMFESNVGRTSNNGTDADPARYGPEMINPRLRSESANSRMCEFQLLFFFLGSSFLTRAQIEHTPFILLHTLPMPPNSLRLGNDQVIGLEEALSIYNLISTLPIDHLQRLAASIPIVHGRPTPQHLRQRIPILDQYPMTILHPDKVIMIHKPVSGPKRTPTGKGDRI